MRWLLGLIEKETFEKILQLAPWTPGRSTFLTEVVAITKALEWKLQERSEGPCVSDTESDVESTGDEVKEVQRPDHVGVFKSM